MNIFIFFECASTSFVDPLSIRDVAKLRTVLYMRDLLTSRRHGIRAVRFSEQVQFQIPSWLADAPLSFNRQDPHGWAKHDPRGKVNNAGCDLWLQWITVQWTSVKWQVDPDKLMLMLLFESCWQENSWLSLCSVCKDCQRRPAKPLTNLWMTVMLVHLLYGTRFTALKVAVNGWNWVFFLFLWFVLHVGHHAKHKNCSFWARSN